MNGCNLFTTPFNRIFGKIQVFENYQHKFHFCWHEIDNTTSMSNILSWKDWIYIFCGQKVNFKNNEKYIMTVFHVLMLQRELKLNKLWNNSDLGCVSLKWHYWVKTWKVPCLHPTRDSARLMDPVSLKGSWWSSGQIQN